MLRRRGSRLGGFSGPMVLRHLGKDTMMLTDSVLKALRAQGVVDAKNPTSQAAQRKVQDAFNAWREESGRQLCQLSQILALSVP